MKKRFLMVVAVLVLIFPLTALAGLLGTGDMEIGYSTPIVDRYYADYDIKKYTYIDGKTIEFASYEAFCISEETLDNKKQPFGFYSAADKLVNANLVTWIANWATTTTSYDIYDTSDKIKGLGQAAIWQLLGVITGDNYSSIFYNINDGLYTYATDQTAYVNQWLVAVNPVNAAIGEGGNQDYLVKASVPEPAATLLVGFGVTGLAVIRRRKKIN